jgi:hypothetical protein
MPGGINFYCNNPESQCMRFNTSWKFCSAMGAFIPMSWPLESWAENMAASPKKAARPEPKGMTAPCSQPPTGILFVSGPKASDFTGSSRRKSSGNTRTGWAEAGAWKAWPVNVLTLVNDSLSLRPSVIELWIRVLDSSEKIKVSTTSQDTHSL